MTRVAHRGVGESRRSRHIIMLDSGPTPLRVNPADVTRRANLERRKLREMIDFCYTEYCYRAHILDYFGDRHHARQCGTCGNCAPNSAVSGPLTSAELLNNAPPTQRRNSKAHIEPLVSSPRVLTADETLRVRKILAAAARMKGRFGKSVLAATLRGSAAKNVMQSHLNELTTYGLLKDMRQDDILGYIDALINASCLRVSPGEYPTILITELGDRVMREQEAVELGLPAVSSAQSSQVSGSLDEHGATKTTMETYALYQQGLPIGEIARQRNCTTGTIEGHLIDCIVAGLAVDTAQFVSASERLQIERAIEKHGADKLKPLRESLAETITYNMIRFVIADLRQMEKAEDDLAPHN